MLSKRSKVYQTSISMSTGGPQTNFGNFPKNQFNLANPSLIPQPMISQSRYKKGALKQGPCTCSTFKVFDLGICTYYVHRDI